MSVLSAVIIIFCLMEITNVIILYSKPNFKYGNGIGCFKFYEESKKDENTHLFVRYMINWVAGTKLIFILLLLLIALFGTETLKLYGVLLMILSISTYYFKLHPIIKKLDENNQINPKGYSNKLIVMITTFIIMFSIAALLSLVL